MNPGVFPRVLIPVEFGAPQASEIAPEHAVQVGDREWVSVSPSTIKALELAARLARGGDVYVVHATPEFIDHATWMPAASISELNDDARRDSNKVLREVAERTCEGVRIHLIIKAGRPLEVILSAAEECAADAIVLAASPRQRIRRAFLGSTADKVIRQSPCPVMVVPAGGV